MRLRHRLNAGDTVLGTFYKTPHPMILEILAMAGFDTVVIDAEHAPFGRAEIDTAILTGRALGLDMVVRLPDDRPATILQVMDAGAAGLLIPHVNTAGQARAILSAMRYGAGGRGFAGTTRAAGYGKRPLHEHLGADRGDVALICQIEDPEGAENAADIASVEGVDGLFVGRADLAVGSGKDDFFDPEIAQATARILGTPGAATGLYCAPHEDLAAHHAAGARLFVVGSDHTAILRGAPVADWQGSLSDPK
ncbi:2-keto-3-deoxy-L-rhamnonate aldolase RhmA [Roseovarius nanhaiticus]|uniref:2-keto-3-deoxy-L-rhamnonate aldolase RhmA n=1 Tax=Roseovarius nanhaiticus TaxID=573024 RepID=A0A1N7HMZ5_9RHOB|nr:aldolase/citrate lyase family protein [Roseovarius nanhaiticus]SEL36764.1 2-keto-3-deoxy-L-rhamnonate aldolase RhmA [Roseovarius nanhaiticus]SIS26227.1 2-keto-3-deoxy-L-rhamnonate aldolase RhmA [Roseovarius nanhaiticus]